MFTTVLYNSFIHSVHKVESKGILKEYRREEQKKSKKLV